MINFECAIFCIFVKFLRVVNLIKGRGVSLLVHDPVFSTWNFSTSKLLNYFSYVILFIKFIIDRTFYGLKLLQRIFVILSVSRDLNHSQGGEGDV